LLSHKTRNRTSAAAYRALREVYPDWEDLLKAPVEEIEEPIKQVTYAGQKARRLRQILQHIKTSNEGTLSLDFLADYGIAEARKWLENIKGVGAKTSAAVLNFSNLRLPALVVDTHHLRVAQRLGIVAPKAILSKAAYQMQAMLPKDWDGRAYYDHHEALMFHGQKCCHYREPACERCPVNNVCPYYQPTAVSEQPTLF
jgi:endonuclease-3